MGWRNTAGVPRIPHTMMLFKRRRIKEGQSPGHTMFSVRQILFVVTLSALVFLNIGLGPWWSRTPSALAEGPRGGSLALSIVPSILPADGSTRPVVYVQRLNRQGEPVFGTDPVRIFLTSSNPEVVSVPQEAEIWAGRTYTVVEATTSLNPGKARLTVVAPGINPSSIEIETVNSLGALPPFRLSLTAQPPVLFPGEEGILTVAMLGSNDVPLLLPSETRVMVASERPDVVEVPKTLVIPPLSYMVGSEWKAREKGQVILAVQADGLEAAITVVGVVEQGSAPTRITINSLVTSLPALHARQEALLLQAVDEFNLPVPFPCTTINITSTAPHIAAVDSPLVVDCQPSKPYLVHEVSTSRVPGTARITAAAAGFGEPATVELSTYGTEEAQIKLETGPPQPVASDPEPANLVIRVADSAGGPVTLHDGFSVRLFSSLEGIPATVTIPPNNSFVSLPIGGKLAEEELFVTAVAPGLAGQSLFLTVARKPLEASIDVPQLGLPLDVTSDISALVTSDGDPVAGAEVEWNSPGLLQGQVSTRTDENGIARISVKPLREDTVTITARATRQGHTSVTASASVSASTLIEGKSSFSPVRVLFPLGMVGLLAGYVCYKVTRRRKQVQDSRDPGDEPGS